MPEAIARSLPKKTPAFGTVRLVSSTGSWDADSVSLAEPPRGCFWVVAWSVDNLSVIYNFGASQDSAHLFTTCLIVHSSSQGTSAMGLLRKKPDVFVSWPSSFSLDTVNAFYRSSSALLFEASPGFLGRSVLAQRTSTGVTSSSFTITPPTNRSKTPGGLAIAFAAFDSGGVGIDNAVTGSGWESPGSWGLINAAYYVLPTDRIVTPPAVSWSAGRSDYWSGGLVYLR